MKTNHIAWIWGVWREKKSLILFLFFLTLLSSAVAVAYPYLSMLIIDAIQRTILNRGTGNPMAEVDRLLLVLMGVGLVGLVSSIFPGIRGMTNSIFEHMIRSRYFRAIVRKNWRFFARFSSGDIVTRLTDDLYDYPKLSWFLCSGIFRAVESGSKVLFCLGMMVFLNPRLTLFSILPLPFIIAVFYVTQDRIYDTFKKNQEAISAINTQLEMSFSGVRIIKSYACEAKYGRFFENVLESRFKTELAVARLETVLHLLFQNIELVAQIGIVFMGGLMAVKGEITVGTFYAFYTYLSMLIFPIIDIPTLFTSGKRAFVNIDRLEELRVFPEDDVPAAPAPVTRIEALEARGVSFSYGDRDESALEGVSFTLARGERLGVIGPIGSGKSTLVKVLCGLLSPSGGEVLVNGRKLSLVDLPSYRALLGYVPQEALLFTGSLKDNVFFGMAEPEEALYLDAVDAAQMRAEIDSFGEKDDTKVGQRGISLSGGQKQRMAIARALARRPELMLFDDITASLDATNEERLMRRLADFTRDMSCVIVSHRLSTLQYVDKVLFLDGGKVMGFGRHEELLANPAYASFMSEHLGTHRGS